MSDFLHTLVQRSMTPAAASVRPRVRSRFEPADGPVVPFAVDPDAGQRDAAGDWERRPSDGLNVPRAHPSVERAPFGERSREEITKQGDPGRILHRSVQHVAGEADDQGSSSGGASSDATSTASTSAADASEAGDVSGRAHPSRRLVFHEPLTRRESGNRSTSPNEGNVDSSSSLKPDRSRASSSPRRMHDEAEDISADEPAGRMPERTTQLLGPIREERSAHPTPEAEEKVPHVPAVTASPISQQALLDLGTPSVIRPRPADRDGSSASRPVDDSAAASSAPLSIRVTIGRIEVRAETPKLTAPTESRPPPPRRPMLSLGEYLEQRQRGAP